MEQFELIVITYRVLTFCILLVMAGMDYKTKTVPSIFPLVPAVFGLLLIDHVLRAGFSIGFYWMFMFVLSGVIGIAMYFTKAWALADSVTITTSTMTMFLYEGVLFNVLCLMAYVAYALNVHRTGRFTITTIEKNGKSALRRNDFPFMLVIVVSYIVALILV